MALAAFPVASPLPTRSPLGQSWGCPGAVLGVASVAASLFQRRIQRGLRATYAPGRLQSKSFAGQQGCIEGQELGALRFDQVSGNASKSDDSTLLLYLPDLDFTGCFAELQYPVLSADFDVWLCQLPQAETRTGFSELLRAVTAWLEKQLSEGRNVVLLGDGFGGLLGLALALQFGRKLRGLALVNPSTRLTKTSWNGLQTPAASSALQRLLSEVGKRASDQTIDLDASSLLSSTALAALGLRSAASAAAAGSLAFRLRRWLRDGWELVRCQLRRQANRFPLPPVLLAYSGGDTLGAPRAEALALKPLLEARCGRLKVQELEGAGLEPLSNASLDLASLLRASPVCQPREDVVNDFTFPSLEAVEEGSEGVERLAAVVSPIFCSCDGEAVSARQFGLGGVPTPEELNGRPVLLVGNHQLFGLDLGPLVREFLLDRGVIARGLAYPGAMRRRGNNQEAPTGQFRTFGAVTVSPRNIFKLLQKGEMVLLFPGGVKEALHGPGDEYKLFWPTKTDFVRVAARFNAVVVPFGGVGADDNAQILGTSGDLRETLSTLPFMPRPREEEEQQGGLMPVSESLAERPSFPFLAPQLRPASSDAAGFGDRCYFSFGEPVDLQQVDSKDRAACGEAYAQIQEAVRREIAWLLEARRKDPYRDLLRRQLYERAANLETVSRRISAGPLQGEMIRSYGRRAPSFPIDELPPP
mmetsp:Transcript_98223/g.174876  ORF Transcript_98223/g.174876 Transcript_98223/m.174876 type:complete len:700 (-) Transcript_98223:6-2105(-)